MSQKATILKHLIEHGHITPAICTQVYRIVDYRKRLSELRQAGYNIKRVTRHDLTGKKYSSWELHGLKTYTPAAKACLQAVKAA